MMFSKKNWLSTYLVVCADKKNEGFTLVEVISTMVITILLLTISLTSYITYNRLFALESGVADIQNDSLFLMDTLTTEVKQAKSIADTEIILGETFTTNTTSLVLAYPVFDINNELVSGITEFGAFERSATNEREVRFVLEAHPSSKRVDQNKIVANHVKNLIFRYNTATTTDATAVSIFLKTFATTTPDQSASFIQSNSTSLRNK